MTLTCERIPKIQNAIQEVCRSIESRVSPTNQWKQPDEDYLWKELVACILGSRVSYEIANAVLQELGNNGLLSEIRRSSRFSKYEADIEDTLFQPVELKDGCLHSSRYPFPKARARQIRQSAETIYGNNETLSSILNNSDDVVFTRQRLASELSGIGPKQASLFLRNIGYSDNLAVLDVHVLSYMNWIGLIPETISSIRTMKQYVELEDIFLSHAKDLGLPATCFDLSVWVVVRVIKRGG